MKLAGVALLVTMAMTPTATPDARYFRYERPIENAPAPQQVCIALDPPVFAHAAPGLADLRVYRGSPGPENEVPFAVWSAPSTEASEKSIAPLNLGRRGGQTVFDAPMPEGSYTDIDLAISGQDFLATVTVSGSQGESASNGTRLGDFTIFDLTHQKLGRSTVLHLPRSDFRYLHFRIAGPVLPESVTGLRVVRPPARMPQFVTVAESSQFTQKNHATVIEFKVPARMPVDRIVFLVGAQPSNFSRDVQISVVPTVPARVDEGVEPEVPYSASGGLLRVHRLENGHRIDEERLFVEPRQFNFDVDSAWTVRIDNGDDTPIQLTDVKLEMLERDVCFGPAAAASYLLFYGDAALPAPRYDYARLFAEQPDAVRASLGPEQGNPSYESRPDPRPFTERHPVLLWIALLLVIAVLGVIALRSMKRMQPTP